MNRFAKGTAVTVGLFFLCAAPTPILGQSSSPGPARTPHMAAPAARPNKDALPPDDFTGLKFTHEQQTKIDQIHQDFKSRMDAVVHDEKSSDDQKQAMLFGFRRLENREVFKALTPEQQQEVRKKVLARRAAEKEAHARQSRPR